MNGKGDKRRQGDNNKFNDNWDRIFGKKEEEDIDTSDVEPFHIKNARELKMQDLEFEARRKQEQRDKFEAMLEDMKDDEG
jgi:PAS domain-containing protein